MDSSMFEYDNKPAQNLIQMLYLDSKTADVHFGFDIDTDNPKRVPAHKSILSVLSPVFDVMFYGSLPEKGDILIADASAESFEDFLQFFYIGKVQLRSKNIADVMNLCKKYEMDEALKICEFRLQMTLTNDDVCWGYAIALFLEQTKLIQFCEQKIKKNAIEVLKSDSFLECDYKTMLKVFELVSKKCCASEIVFGYMEWSKAECMRNDLEIISKNLRAQFGEFFEKIPFSRLTIEQFTQHIITYKGFFGVDELENNIQQIVTNKTIAQENEASDSDETTDTDQSEWNELIIDRRFYNDYSKISGNLSTSNFYCINIPINCKLFLTEFYITLKTSKCYEKRIMYEIYRKSFFSKKSFGEQQLTIPISNDEIHIVLPEPILINKGIYEIWMCIDCANDGEKCLCGAYCEQATRLDNDMQIGFYKDDLISKLVFKMSDN